MKLVNRFIGAIILMFLLGAPVFAQDIGHQLENWKGTYFGLYFGSGQGKANTSMINNSVGNVIFDDAGLIAQQITTTLSSGKLSGNITGSVADLLLGYNFHPLSSPKLVFGGQLEGSFFNALLLGTQGSIPSSSLQTISDGNATSISLTDASNPTEYIDELTSMFSFVGRGGVLVNPNILTYILVGGVENNFVLPSSQDLVGKNRGIWVLGYTVGAGLEYRISNHWSFRGEYRFLNVNNINRKATTEAPIFSDPEGPNNIMMSNKITTQQDKTHLNLNIGAIGVIYRPHWG